MKKLDEREEQPQEEEFKVDDRRHWNTEGDDDGDNGAEVIPAIPTVLDEYRLRAEAAERTLQEYISAHKQFRDEQDQFRLRLQRDVTRRVQIEFAGLVRALLDSLDNLDLAVDHIEQAPQAESLGRGVRLARDGFLTALEQQGVLRFSPDNEPFDPNIAEAVRVDPVASETADNLVSETLRPGYRLEEQIVRPAQVAVGRYLPTSDNKVSG